MACKGDIEREKKLAKMVEKHIAKRTELKKKIIDQSLKRSERVKYMFELDALGGRSSKVRQRSRCKITGSTRSVFRFFGLGRHAIRELVMQGKLPGVVKASW